MALLKFITFFGLISFSVFSFAETGEWQTKNINFQYTLQANNPWWGCRSAQPKVEEFLNLIGAENVNIFCEDNQGRSIPQVRFWIQLDNLTLNNTSLTNPIEVNWGTINYQSQYLCGFQSEFITQILKQFEKRNQHLMTVCDGEDGNISLQVDLLFPEEQ